MYFKTLNESIKFTLKNIGDVFSQTYDEIGDLVKKFKKSKREFNTYYHIDDKCKRQLRFAINNIKQTDTPINLGQIMKFIKKHILVMSVMSKRDRNSMTPQDIYCMFYKVLLLSDIPSPFTTYTYPYILDNNEIIMMCFDEKEIKDFVVLCSRNMYDPDEEVYLVSLNKKDVDPSLFYK